MEENKTYRIRTKVGDDSDKVIQVKLDQHYDSFEILSLKIDQSNNYKTYESDYGVVVGRVLANGGFGIPNAKVSIFIESDGNDNLEDRILYPYKSPTSKNADGVRYNLLTDFLDKACYRNVGTFPNKRLVLDNDDVIDIFDKYYRYTTVTNNAGDYMIFGVPTGSQRMHVDIDLSDIGMLSQRPRDMIYKGYNIDLFDSPNKFKKDTNLNSLAQIISQDIGLYVYPYWGDTSDDSDNIAVTRADINIDYKFEPTCVFMGSIVTDTGSNAIGKNCTSTEKVGKMSELIAGEGSIEMIRKTIDGRVEEFQVKGNRVIDGDGVWCYQIPMNLDYIMTDEFGNIVPSDNPEKGIPTRTRVRFRISIDDAPEDNTARKRCRYLVPNNPRLDEELYPNFTKTKEVDYEFGTKTKNENYRDLLWNKVYTVKNYVPRLQKNRRYSDRRHTGIKLINHHEANNPMPYNNADIKLTFTYRMLCIIFKIFIAMVEFLNETLTLISLAFCALYLVFHKIANFFKHDACISIPLGFKTIRLCPFSWLGTPFQWIADLFWAMILPCIPISADMCGENTTHRVTFFPGCGDLIFTNASVGAVGLSCITDKSCDSQMKKEDRAIKAGEMDESERTSCVFKKGKQELFNCIETALAEDNDVVSLNFQNDWVNGTLYAPMWFRKITKKKSYFFGLFKRRAKDQWCEGEKNYARKILRVFNPCSPERPGKYSYKNYEDDTVSARYINFSDNKKYPKSCRSNCHKSTAAINLDKGLIVKRQTMLGQDVYYYKPVEYSSPQESLITNSDDFAVGEDGKNGSVKILFATDIVLLGSLNDCDLHGVPQFFKSLESTTFNMPPNILFADNEVTITITEDDGKVIYGSSEDSVSEMTGMDWGNYNEDLCGSWKESQDSGLFYSIGCSTIEMKPKSCVNMTRICEYGVSLDETVSIKNETEASSEFTPSDEQLFDTIVPDGFVSKDELYNDDERSLFATLNINGLKTERNNENGLMEYEFKHVVVDNFDKSLYASMADRQTKCNKTQRYNYVLEEFSKGYYDFRMGKKPYFYDKEGKLPRYENSFYFYFGLTAGKTALDKFNSQFTSDCNNDNETLDIIGIDVVGNGWCNEMNCECNGYVKFDLSAVDLPCDIVITSQFDEFEVEINDNDDEMFFIGNLDYIDEQTLAELDEAGYVHKDITDYCTSCKCNGKFCMKNGTYSVTVTDNNGEIVNTTFVMKADYLSSYIVGTDFDEAENVLLKQFRTYKNIAKNADCLPNNSAEANINTTRGIGGTIAISTPFNSKTGDAICDFLLTISCPDISVEGYENGYNVAIKCHNWCDGNGGHREGTVSPNPIELLMKNKDVFIFGVPKGDETYTVTITELCDDRESNNIFVESVRIKQSDSFKLFVNGVVDYDVIKHWKCGFDCDAGAPKVTPVRNPKISDKWWHMSNRDNYLWFNYIPYMDIDRRIMELLRYYDNAVEAINADGYGAIYNSIKDSTYESIRNYSVSLGHFLLVKNIIINNSNDNEYSWSPSINPEALGGWERDLTGIVAHIEVENGGLTPLTGEGGGGLVNAGLTYVRWSDGTEISWAEYYLLSDSEKENYTDKTTYSLYLECVSKGYIAAGDYTDFKTKLENNSLVVYVGEDDCTIIVTVDEYNAVNYELKNPDVYSEYFNPSISQSEYDNLGYYNKDDYSDWVSQETYDAFEYVNPRTHAHITKEEYDNLGYMYPPCNGYSITKEEYDNGEFGFVKRDERCTILTNAEYDLLGYTRTDELPNDPDGILDNNSFPPTVNQSAFDNLGYIYICDGVVTDYLTKSDYDLGKFPYYRIGDKCDLVSESEYDTFGYVLTENIEISGNVVPFSPYLNGHEEYDSLGYIYICDGVAVHEITEQEYENSENLGYAFNCQFTSESKHYLKFPISAPVHNVDEIIGDDVYDTLGYIPSRLIAFEGATDVITFEQYMQLSDEDKAGYSVDESALYDAFELAKPEYGVYGYEGNEELYDFCLKDLYYNSEALSVTDYISKQTFYSDETENYGQLDDTDYVTLKDYYDSDKYNYRPLTAEDFLSAQRFFTCVQCERYLPIKDLYELSDDMESYLAMLIKDVLECWRDANDDESVNGNAEDLINSVFNSLYDINESLIEEINSVEELKTEFVDETKKAFQLNCDETPQNIFFTATTKNKPVIYHGVYKDEILDETTNLYKLDSKYTYTNEGSSIEVISIPTISYEDSFRFGNKDEQTSKKQNNGIETYGLPLCYASDNIFNASNKKLCNFIAVINSRNRRIPNDVEPLAKQSEICPDDAREAYNEIKLTKKYFGYHIIDKIFEINHMAWSCVDKVPYFKPLRENTNCIDDNKAGVSMCMKGLFTGKLFNGNPTKDEPYGGYKLLKTEFEQQTLGDEYDIEIFTGYDPAIETIEDVEDKMPTRRYVGNSSPEDENKQYEQFRVTNSEETAQEAKDDNEMYSVAGLHKQYVPVVNSEMDMIIEDKNGCQLLEHIDGRMKIKLSETSINMCRTKLKDRKKGCKLDVFTENNGNATGVIYLVFSAYDSAGNVRYPLNLTEELNVTYERGAEKNELTDIFDEFNEAASGLEPGSEEYNALVSQYNEELDGYLIDDEPVTITDDISDITDEGNNIVHQVDENEYSDLPDEDKAKYEKLNSAVCRKTKFDCKMTDGKKRFFTYEGGQERNLFSFYNEPVGYNRYTILGKNVGDIRGIFGKQKTTTGLVSKMVIDSNDSETKSYGYGSTGEFTFDRINGYSDAYYVIAVTDRNQRTISPVYDFPYICARLIFGVIYTKQETVDEDGVVNGYEYVASPKATFDIANVIKESKCNDKPNKLPDLNCIQPEQILYYFYYYPYDIEFVCDVDGTNVISGSYKHPAYRHNVNGEMGGYQLFDIDLATYKSLYKTYRNSKQKVGKTIRKNTTIIAKDYTGLRHDVDWQGCKQGSFPKEQGCGHPYAHKLWVQVTWIPNCGTWQPSENCDKFIDIDGGGCDKVDGEYVNEFFGTDAVYTKIFEVISRSEYNDLDEESKKKYRYKPSDVGDLYKDDVPCGWSDTYDGSTDVSNNEVLLCYDDESDIEKLSMIYYALCGDDFVTVSWQDCFGNAIGLPVEMRPGTVISETEMNAKRPGTYSDNAFKEWKFYRIVNGELFEDSSLIEYIPGVGYAVLPDVGDCIDPDVSEIVIKASCMQDLGSFIIDITNYVRWRSVHDCYADGINPRIVVFCGSVWDYDGQNNKTNIRSKLFYFNKVIQSNINGPTNTSVTVNLVAEFGTFCGYSIKLVGLFTETPNFGEYDNNCYSSVDISSGQGNYLSPDYYCGEVINVFVDGETSFENEIGCDIPGDCSCYEDERRHHIDLSTIDYSKNYTIVFSDSEDHSTIYKTSTFFDGEMITYSGDEPTKEGKTFNGWLNSNNEAPGIAKHNDTFYAQWKNGPAPVGNIITFSVRNSMSGTEVQNPSKTAVEFSVIKVNGSMETFRKELDMGSTPGLVEGTLEITYIFEEISVRKVEAFTLDTSWFEFGRGSNSGKFYYELYYGNEDVTNPGRPYTFSDADSNKRINVVLHDDGSTPAPTTPVQVSFYKSLDDLTNERQPLSVLDADSNTHQINVSDIPTPSQEGMTFKCWAKRGESNEYTNDAFIGLEFFQDTKFYAKYNTNKINVCFDLNLPEEVEGKDAEGNVISPVVSCSEINYGSAPTVPQKPTLNGWDFSAWALGQDELTDEQVGNTTLEVDTTYTAVWNENPEMKYYINWWLENYTDRVIQAVDVYLAFLVNGTEVTTQSRINAGGGIGVNGGHRWNSDLTTVRFPDGWTEMYAYSANIDNASLVLGRDRIETKTGVRAGSGSSEYITDIRNENYKKSYLGGERFIVVKLLGEPVPITYIVTFNVTDTDQTFVRNVKTMTVDENHVITSSEVPPSAQLLSYANNGQNGKYNPNFTWNIEPVGKTITEPCAFNAIFEINKFTAEFVWVEGVAGSVIVTDIPYGEYVPSNRVPQASQAPSREGYTFVGWNPNPSNTPITENGMVFYGEWEQQTVEQGEIKFRVRDDDDYSTPIVYWNMDSFTITKDVGSTIERNDIPSESDILAATPDSRAYYFDADENDNGWYASPDGNGDPYGKVVSSVSTTYTAAVYEHKFWAEFNPANGGSITKQQYIFGSSVPMPQNEPTYSGHSFVGWQCDQGGTVYSTGQSYTHDYVANKVVFTAQWSTNQVSVSFYSEGTLIETIPVNIGGTVTPPSVTVSDPETLRFKDAWIRRSDNHEYSTSELSALPITTIMSFDAKIVALHKVVFYTADYTKIGNTRTVEHNGHVTAPTTSAVNAVVTPTGKTYMGDWRKNGPQLDNSLYPIMSESEINNLSITEDLNFYARLSCTVTFDYGSESSQSADTFSVEKRTVLSANQIPTPNAVSGYTFDGWDGNTSERIMDNTTFTAQWVANNGFTVTFYNCGGEVIGEPHTNVPEGTVYGVTSGYNYPSATDASTFHNGTGCLFGGEWVKSPATINNVITSDTVYHPVCSCTNQTYIIKFGIHNNMAQNVQFNKFSVVELNYTLRKETDSVHMSTSYNYTIDYGNFVEITVENVGAYSEISLDEITIRYNTEISGTTTLWLNGSVPDENGYLASVRLYKNGSPIGGGDNITSTTFAQSQNGIYMTVVISKETRDAENE